MDLIQIRWLYVISIEKLIKIKIIFEDDIDINLLTIIMFSESTCNEPQQGLTLLITGYPV
jgi:hypothetical protein